MITRCRECHEPVQTIKTEGGRTVWISVDPDPEGTVLLRVLAPTAVLLDGLVAAQKRADGTDLHSLHRHQPTRRKTRGRQRVRT